MADVFVAAQSNAKENEPLQTPITVFRCPSDTTPALCPVPTVADPEGARYIDKGTWERRFNGANSPDAFQPPTSDILGSQGMVDASCPGTGAVTNWRPDLAV